VTPVVVIDPADFSPEPTKFRIDKITYAVDPPLTVYLYWDAASPVMIDTLTDTYGQSYIRFGGLQNNATDPTGAISLGTEGYVALSTVNFSLVLWLVKQGATATTDDAFLLLETGDFLLLEDGGELILE
jgi:hypothetical protein